MPPKRKKDPARDKTVEQPIATHPGKMDQSLMMGIVFALIVIGLGGGYYGYRLIQDNKAVTSNNVVVTTNISQEISQDNTNYFVTDVNSAGTSLGPVTWQERKETSSLNLVKTSTDYTETSEKNAKYFQVGTVNEGLYAGAKVILMSLTYDSPQGTNHFYFIQKNDNLTAIAKNSGVLSADATQDTLDRSKFTTDVTYELPGLRFPARLQGPKPRQNLVQDTNVKDLFSTDGLTKVFTDPTYGAVYTKTAQLASSVDYNSNTAVDAFLSSTAFDTRNGFYLRAPDETVRVYRLAPDIISLSTDGYSLRGQPNITWTDGQKNTDTFDFTFASGCGSVNYINVIPSEDLSIQKDLQQVGTSVQGDVIYALKDTTNKLLKDFYTNTGTYNQDGTQSSKTPYDDFIASHPMIFWVDPFDRLIQLTNTKFAPLAECGKPVIYLYPQQTTNVDVILKPQGGFTYTEPAYDTGWHVTAQPNGQLTERATGKTYPYLFWEGRGGIYTSPTKGFVVAQADVHNFLPAKLVQVGLNDQETADFIEFWEPRMQGSPYYFVSFAGNRVMDEIAPLTVTPKPDTVIRVLMDFRPLQQPITVQPQTLHTPTRTGFTIVEWGGVLR